MFFITEYNNIGFYALVSLIVACLIFFLSYIVSTLLPNTEKLSTYECGFDPFEESLGRFDIKFYLVAILFLVFDLEISFLFP